MLQDKTQWLTNKQKIKTFRNVKYSLFSFNQNNFTCVPLLKHFTSEV